MGNERPPAGSRPAAGTRATAGARTVATPDHLAFTPAVLHESNNEAFMLEGELGFMLMEA